MVFIVFNSSHGKNNEHFMLLFNLECTLNVTQSTQMSVYVTIILLAHLAHTQ